jgi:hypothetical protein
MRILSFLGRVCPAAALFLIAWPAAAQCPPKTNVTDTIYNADGTLASGRVTISWQTFQIGSCAVVAGRTTVIVTNGALSVQLYPNDAAVPDGSSYRVSYALRSGVVTTEYWVVPTSTPPVNLSAVRSATVPVPNVMFAQSQVTNLSTDLAKKIELPSPCVTGKFLQRNSSSSQPQVDCVDPPSGGGGGSGSQHQVNGVNLAANDPINIQNSAAITFANPSAGNIQADVANSSITASKLSVANPSGAQLSGISDSNISPAALSPNRTSGTAVVQSRSLATSAPLSGGGDLSADRTLSCPTCEVTSNKNGANGYAGLNANARVGISHGGVDISTYTLGDLLYASAANVLSRLAGNSTTTRKFLRQTGDGANSAAPVWDILQSADIPNNAANTSGTAATATSLAANGTNCASGEAARGVDAQGNAEGCFTPAGGSNHNLLSSTHTDTTSGTVQRGDFIAGIGASPTWQRVAKGGTNGYPKWNASGDLVASNGAASGVGSCTNQFARTLNADAAPTCATVQKADAVSTFVHTDQSNTYSTGTQDFESASVTRPFRRLAFASFPGSCTANREFIERSDPATAGQVLYVCNAAGNGWDLVGDGGGAGSGITSLGGQTGSTQTFSNDTNVTITSSSNNHALGWTGALSATRGGNGGAPTGDDYIPVADSSSAITFRQLADCPNLALATSPGNIQSLRYDASTNTFSCVDQLSVYGYVCEWYYFTTTNGCPIIGTSSGTGASSTNNVAPVVTNEVGVGSCTTGTTATGRCVFSDAVNASTTLQNMTFGGGETFAEFKIRIPTLSTSAERYYLRLGFLDSNTNAAPTDGAYLMYDEGGASTEFTGSGSANWRCVTVSNNSRTTATSTTAVNNPASSYDVVRVTVDASAANARFYVNGTELTGGSCSPLTTNIPASTARLFGVAAGIIKTVGTTSRSIEFARWTFQMKLTSPRN